jgi:sulfate adenylyltransferase subunit 1
MVLPSGLTSDIASIDLFGQQLTEAFPPMSVTISLTDDLDISRGDMIVKAQSLPQSSQDIDVMMCWMNEKPLQPDMKYAVKHTTRDARCIVREVMYKVNVNTLERIEDDKLVRMNDIARVSLRMTKPLFFDSYNKNRRTGALILINEATNETVGVAMIV